ncbi:D-TA family PLP-dependent enzyme [Panacibacter sp. KCS-6]|uniref:D-TA family PLP-dependent enzyme n=2 Tax=Limnovirga soli TaxID=2656915 RepID=A0A8J8FD28_9BACT|nr:D-TA family PLP-dependent enzyme [Limnovirga soli]
MMDWYQIENIATIDSPALVVYKQRVQTNIAHLLQMVHQQTDKLRPHVKTNKISEVCQMLLDAGITKYKCATIAEAEMLGLLHAPDVLLAYQPTAAKAARLFALISAYPQTHFSCLVDNLATATLLSAMAGENKMVLSVFVDLNTGMNRTGIKPTDATALCQQIQSLPNVHLTGLHGYDGHIRDTNVADRQQHADNAFATIIDVAEAINKEGEPPLTIVAGGSPTFPMHADRAGVECSPGTFVFWDWGYKHTMPDEPFEYAALVITRVVSIIDQTSITTDLGHKSVAAENPMPRVYFLNAPEVTPIGQSEEHLVAKVPDATKYQVGDVLYGVPLHICPTVALYETAVVIEKGLATTTWKVVARDRKITI